MKIPSSCLAALVAAFLAACAGGGSRMTYADVQALNPGVSARWIVEEFPQGRVTRGRDGKVESISFNVKDPQGKGQSLRLLFDRDEILTRKVYSGAVVRPGGAHSQPVSR